MSTHFPLQLLPPFNGSGSLQFRVLDLVPLPQVFEHSDHGSQADHSPSITSSFGVAVVGPVQELSVDIMFVVSVDVMSVVPVDVMSVVSVDVMSVVSVDVMSVVSVVRSLDLSSLLANLSSLSHCCRCLHIVFCRY